MAASPSIVLGLLGGVAAGKSAVARLLAAEGAVVVDADALAREVAARPDVTARIERELGPGLLGADGTLDRQALAGLVFSSSPARRALEAILHPEVRAALETAVANHRRRGGLLVIDAPLLLESGLDRLCDELLLVTATAAVREARARARGWPPGDRRRREEAQADLALKASRARFQVANDGPLAETRARLREVLAILRAEGRL